MMNSPKIEDTVSSWPNLFINSIQKESNSGIKKIDKKIKIILSQANRYWWRAYNIYDDLLDDDSGPGELPIANTYLIKFLNSYYKINLPKKFYHTFNKIIIKTERANLNEFREDKIKFKNGKVIFPKVIKSFADLKSLSEKSLPLCLGPVAIMYYTKCSDKKIRSCVNFFKNFLSAKQLSDDAHDWLDDFMAGKITAVSRLIMLELKKNNIKLDLHKNPEVMLQVFLKINPTIAKLVLRLCEDANQEAYKIGMEENCKFLQKTTLPITTSAIMAQSDIK